MEEVCEPGDGFLSDLRRADNPDGLDQLLDYETGRGGLPVKLFVFNSWDLHPRQVWKEFSSFVICRMATGLFTLVAMIVMVSGLKISQDFICKIAVSVISLVLNYVLSKLFIFNKK